MPWSRESRTTIKSVMGTDQRKTDISTRGGVCSAGCSAADVSIGESCSRHLGNSIARPPMHSTEAVRKPVNEAFRTAWKPDCNSREKAVEKPKKRPVTSGATCRETKWKISANTPPESAIKKASSNRRGPVSTNGNATTESMIVANTGSRYRCQHRGRSP